jgi:hypothetical protein
MYNPISKVVIIRVPENYIDRWKSMGFVVVNPYKKQKKQAS